MEFGGTLTVADQYMFTCHVPWLAIRECSTSVPRLSTPLLFSTISLLFQLNSNFIMSEKSSSQQPSQPSLGSSEPSVSSSGASSSAKGQKKKRPNRTSKAHRAKVQSKQRKKLIKNVRVKRKEELRERGPSVAYSNYGRGCAVSFPKISVMQERLLTGTTDVSEETMSFYRDHWYQNQYLEVSERPNVSNPGGESGRGKGVFAKKFIPAGTRVCPYLGRCQSGRCAPDVACQYDLQLERGFFLCAREKMYDIGYLQVTNQERDHSFITEDAPCPPNYGRYFNTASGADRVNNCSFEIAGDGLDAMFIETTYPVAAGEELLVDYGKKFFIPETTYSESECGSEVEE